MAAFQQGLSSAQVETARERERLAEQIRQLSVTSAAMSTETRSLTRALKNDSQAQGAWGEMVLGTVLSRSGLREGEEYVTQKTHHTEEGGRLRPDVVVNLPDGRRIVVDSKVSLTAFTEHVAAGDDAVRSAALARHAASLRAHVRGLSRKGYARAVGSELDFVILFVPIEAALATAMQEDPDLIAFAAEHDVALSTPTTLLVALRTAASIWQVERRNRNAEAIAERAGKLHDRFVAFAEELKGVGTGLDRARASYDAALGKLSSGPGNLVRQVEMLKELGARSSKALPLELVEAERETG
jgi:DNA recombination protein RmuC